jgi:type III secretion YscU/HrpY family protein
MADSDEDSGGKTEKPTAKKLRDARKKGEVAKSRDVTATAGILVILALAGLALPWLGARLAALVRASFEVMQEPFANAAPRLGWQALMVLLGAVAAVIVPVALVGALAGFIQAGPVMTAEKIKPKADNLNPAKGLKRMFSMDNLLELLKSICKTAIVGSIAWLTIKSVLPSLPLLVNGLPDKVGPAFWHVSLTLLAWAGGAFVLVSAADFAWQRYSYLKKMRMSLSDIRREMKEEEGDPHLKGHRKQLQQQWAQQGANQAAGQALALVVNPAHVAIAIDYDRERCPVPTVTAKGEDDDALAMRQAAREAGVPVLGNVQLARQLLADAQTGDLVPKELFDIIASVVLWAQDVRRELARLREGAADAEANADAGGQEKAYRRRAPPGEDLTDYGPWRDLRAQGRAGWNGFMRYVPRRWRKKGGRYRDYGGRAGARQR